MRNEANDTRRRKQIKLAEAGILFVLALAITVFVGMKFAGQVTEPVATGDEAVAAIPATPIPEADPAVATTTGEDPGTEQALSAGSEASGPDTVASAPAVAPPAITYALAEATYFEGRFAEAAGMFASYVAEHPDNAWGHYMLGLASWKDGDLEGAEESFGQALTLAPDHQKSLVNLGRVLIALDRPAEAVPHLERAIELDPGYADAYRVLGRAYHNLAQRDEAEQAYSEALRRDDADAWSLNNLGLLYIEGEEFARALPPLALAVSLRDDVACFRNNLGIALERCGHYAAASEQYAEAVELDAHHDRAALSLERVTGLEEAADLAPVDLAALAAAFSVAPDATALMSPTEDAEPATLAEARLEELEDVDPGKEDGE